MRLLHITPERKFLEAGKRILDDYKKINQV